MAGLQEEEEKEKKSLLSASSRSHLPLRGVGSQSELSGFYRGVYQAAQLTEAGKTLDHARFWIPLAFDKALKEWALFEFKEPQPDPAEYGAAAASTHKKSISQIESLSYDERFDLYRFFYHMANYKLRRQVADTAGELAAFRFEIDGVLPVNDEILPLDIVIKQLPALCNSLVDKTRGDVPDERAKYWLAKIVKTYRGQNAVLALPYKSSQKDKIFLWFHKDVYDHVGVADALWLSFCSIIPTVGGYFGFQAGAQASLAPNVLYQQLWSLLANIKWHGVGEALASSKIGVGVFGCALDCVLGLCFARLAYEIEIKAYKKRRWIEVQQSFVGKCISEENRKVALAECSQDIATEAAALKAKLKGGMVSWQLSASLVNLTFNILIWTNVWNPSGLLMLAVCASIAIAAGAAEAYGYSNAFENKEREKFIKEYKEYVSSVDKKVYAEDKAQVAWSEYKATNHFKYQKARYRIAAFFSGFLWQFSVFLPGFVGTLLPIKVAVWHCVSVIALNLGMAVFIKCAVAAIFKWQLEKTPMTRFIEKHELEEDAGAKPLTLSEDDGRAVIAAEWPDEQANRIAGYEDRDGNLSSPPKDYNTIGLRISQWMGQKYADRRQQVQGVELGGGVPHAAAAAH